MTQSIYGLTVDYLNDHGHFMVLSSAHGLQQNELSDFQLNMLAANRIPHLLELQLEAKEGDVQLYYRITGKRMLAHFLRMEKLTMHRYFSLLHRIVEVLCDSKVYMLLPDRYILKEEFIYCGSGLEDLHLTYVPKEQLEGKEALSSDLQQLASKWIHRVTELHGTGYQELMNCLFEENFNLPELKQLLLKHMRLTSSSAAQPPAALSDPHPRDEPREWTSIGTAPPAAREKPAIALDRHAADSVRNDAADLLRIETGFSASAVPGAPISSESIPDSHERAVKDIGRKRLLLVLMAVLVVCFIWKWYAESMETSLLYGCAAATAAVGAATVLLLRKTRPKQPQVRAEEPVYDIPEQGDSRFFNEIGLSDPAEPEAFVPPKEPPAEMHTTLLQRNDATVFLGKTAQALETAQIPYLEYSNNGAYEKVPLDKSSFVIGRAGDGTDWVQEEAGVSRMHAEIVKEDAGYGIKDLGSKNGTLLNGEILVPYRVHPLKEGDIVKIVTKELVFKMGL
ncbi:hypothetical protein PAESOLCIP111_04956 [Paenibacillus solanacearum]|uniref:FHA domain-containing protein n=1 Tax=Paenibacillus solanacearum TaxID=2048548 RepID=A0A916K585_9BACL|nr:DUF6382 domain-containing protein [Paenibacillus solanacearum]CAG7645467.1 hypothetical protein PAESOLCIP111_04956 [Paenibacillus solanacearum]